MGYRALNHSLKEEHHELGIERKMLMPRNREISQRIEPLDFALEGFVNTLVIRNWLKKKRCFLKMTFGTLLVHLTTQNLIIGQNKKCLTII